MAIILVTFLLKGSIQVTDYELGVLRSVPLQQESFSKAETRAPDLGR